MPKRPSRKSRRARGARPPVGSPSAAALLTGKQAMGLVVAGALLIAGIAVLPDQSIARRDFISRQPQARSPVDTDLASRAKPKSASQASAVGAGAASPPAMSFGLCGRVRHNCVVDGDTFWFDGEKYRIADMDTPEIHEPKCDSEYRRGLEARDYLSSYLSKGPFELSPGPDRSHDRYGRTLVIVSREGSSVADQLIALGLARPWTGRRMPWCM